MSSKLVPLLALLAACAGQAAAPRGANYIESLGVDVVWLNPVYQSPNADNGYDISDYRAIMREMVTMAEFDAMLEGLHRRGIRLIMDLVVNHTSAEHPWFRQSRSGRDNAYRDYYHWWPGRAGRSGAPVELLRRGGQRLALRLDHPGVLPALLQPGAARSQVGEPARASGSVRHHEVLVRQGGGRLPHGRHPLHLQGHHLPCPAGLLQRQRRGLLRQGPEAARVSAGDEPRGAEPVRRHDRRRRGRRGRGGRLAARRRRPPRAPDLLPVRAGGPVGAPARQLDVPRQRQSEPARIQGGLHQVGQRLRDLGLGHRVLGEPRPEPHAEPVRER